MQLTTLPPSCVDRLELWKPQPPGTSRPVQVCAGIALHFFIILVKFYVLLTIHFILTNSCLTSSKMYRSLMKLECDATVHCVLLENCTSFLVYGFSV